MAVSRVRVEFIRFALLLTMTVALISVATRHGDDNSSGRNQASRGHHPASSAPSPSSGQTEAPSQGSTSPSGSSGQPSTPSHGSNNGGAGATSGGGGGSSGGSEPSAPTLPRTGGTQALELAAFAVLLIGAGSFGMRISRPRASAVQAEAPPTAATQRGHAFGSSESNRPGTT